MTVLHHCNMALFDTMAANNSTNRHNTNIKQIAMINKEIANGLTSCLVEIPVL